MKKDGTGYIYEDETDYLPTHYAGLVVPAMSYGYHYTSNTEYPSEVSSLTMEPTSTEQTGIYAFSPVHSMDNTWHNAILISYGPYDPDTDTFASGYKPDGAQPLRAQHNIYYPNSYTLPPNCELMRVDQALFLHVIHLAFVGGNKTSAHASTNDMTDPFQINNASPLGFSLFGFSNLIFNVVTSTASARAFRVPTAGGKYTWSYWNDNRFDTSPLDNKEFTEPFPRCFYPDTTSTTLPHGPIKFLGTSTRNSPAVRCTTNTASPPITIENATAGNCYPVFFLDND